MKTINRVCVILFIGLTSQGVMAATWTDPSTGIEWTYDYQHDGSVSLGGGECAVSVSTSGELVIPSTIKGQSVTSIGGVAFSDCIGLTSVTIPSSVTSIGGFAFAYCSGLESVTIPSSVTSIGEGAFFNCSGLKSVIIPSSVTSIEDELFTYCSGLESVTIPEGVTSIGWRAFEGCVGLTSVTIPSSVTNISSDAFANCRVLTSVTIPESVTSIGDYAFYGCESLTSVTIPEGVMFIEDFTFYGCSAIKSVTLPSTLLSIGDYAFYDCWGVEDLTMACMPDGFRGCFHGLKSVIVCPGVTYIDDYAFENCDLKSVTIPESVTSIGEGAFSYCEELQSVTIPSSVTSIGRKAFMGCYSLTKATIPSGVTSIGESTFYHCALTEMFIPEGVTSIGEYAFADCSELTSITIPASVTSIGEYAFRGCSELTSVMMPGQFELSSVFLDSLKITSLTIADGLTSIREGAFAYCSELMSVSIPSSVTNIGNSAFMYCSGLKSMTIPSSVTSIGYGAFMYCSGLKSVTIPSSVTSIGPSAFVECSGLQEVYFQGEPPVVCDDFYVYSLRDAFVYYKEEPLDVCIRYNAKYTQQWLPVLEACGIENAEPYVCAEVIIAGEKVTIETELFGYKATGLPSGLKYDAKTGKITGAAKAVTATDGVVVRFTKSGAADEEMTIVVRKEEISVGCEGLSSGSLSAGVAGAAGGMDIQIDSEGGTKSVSVAKLPAGMKYDSKSGKITGVPTKAGEYEVVLTVTTTYGNKETVKIPVSVAAMPVMAVGTFTGFVNNGTDNLGTFTLTTTDAGKLTAKVITAAGTVSFSGTYWDSVEKGVYRVTLTTKKGETLTLTLDANAGWDENQLTGEFTTALIPAKGKSAEIPSRTYSVSAQRNAFGKTWYFAADGNEAEGWTFAYAENAKSAVLTVTLKADGSTAIAGSLPNGADTKGKAVSLKVSASGYANVGGMREGAILADFAPIVTVNKVKRALSIHTNLWFDRKNDHPDGVGGARFVE